MITGNAGGETIGSIRSLVDGTLILLAVMIEIRRAIMTTVFINLASLAYRCFHASSPPQV